MLMRSHFSSCLTMLRWANIKAASLWGLESLRFARYPLPGCVQVCICAIDHSCLQWLILLRALSTLQDCNFGCDSGWQRAGSHGVLSSLRSHKPSLPTTSRAFQPWMHPRKAMLLWLAPSRAL